MAKSKFIWCVTYDDYTVEFVKAFTVWQILEYGIDKLKNDIDDIININRIDLVGGWQEEECMLDLCSRGE